jgi:hypothetical protein
MSMLGKWNQKYLAESSFRGMIYQMMLDFSNSLAYLSLKGMLRYLLVKDCIIVSIIVKTSSDLCLDLITLFNYIIAVRPTLCFI